MALVAVLVGACAATPGSPALVDLDIAVLAPVESWAIQLQGLDPVSSPTTLARQTVDMLVIEPMRSLRDQAEFPMSDLVRRVQKSPGRTLPSKRCIAYLNAGQAEDYRTYWRPEWRAPTADAPGEPAFLLSLDPDGWQGNYPVAFWRPEWRRCLFGHPEAPLDQILDDGFDGIYVDWVLGFADPGVRAAAARDGVDPAREMVRLLADLRCYARARRPLFAVIVQNALTLAEQCPDVLRTVDALAQEDLSFRGRANAGWNDPEAGDIATPAEGDGSTAQLGVRLAAVRARGVPIFTLDYALLPTNVARAVANSQEYGCVPCVSRTPLDRLPQ